MDIRQMAGIFGQTLFDSYDFSSGVWEVEAFPGQLKYAPEAFSINNLSSRKRMLFIVPENAPLPPVVRTSVEGIIFLVENAQTDYHNNTQYNVVHNVHQAAGTAQVNRRLPVGPSGNPGWAVTSMVENTFADVAFNRVPTDQDSTVNQYGLYILYMPSNTAVQDHDTVTTGGKTYFVFEVFPDQGLICAKCTVKPDPRIDVVYTQRGVEVYDYDTSTVTTTDIPFNVTAQVAPIAISDIDAANVSVDVIKFLIDTSWLGIAPKVNDTITAYGKVYRVEKIAQDPIRDQWEIIGNV